MDYFDKKKNVLEYIKMVEGYNDDYIVQEVFNNLPFDKKMLELGLGSGHDLDELKKHYDITGTDKSLTFLEIYQEKDSEVKLHMLDAVKMDIDDSFDYIYSNKVLIHLTDKEMAESFKNQIKVLNDDGLLFHSFWKGYKKENHHGLLFNYKTKQTIIGLTDKYYDFIKYQEYSEMEKNDSFYIILKKKKNI